jgi:HD-like signal output (HDOD) protein
MDKLVDVGLFVVSTELVLSVLAELHAEQGVKLLQHWNIPEVYINIARDHDEEKITDKDPMLACIRLVNFVHNLIIHNKAWDEELHGFRFYLDKQLLKLENIDKIFEIVEDTCEEI